MSADPNLNERDFELLSAYLDGELIDSERLALEIRLDAEPELRRELNELRQTVQMIRQMPTIKAPRDFTLAHPDASSADRASMTPRRPLPLVLRPAFSTFSAAAAVLLVVLGGYWLSLSGRLSLPTPSRLEVAQAPTQEPDATRFPATAAIQETSGVTAQQATEGESTEENAASNAVESLAAIASAPAAEATPDVDEGQQPQEDDQAASDLMAAVPPAAATSTSAPTRPAAGSDQAGDGAASDALAQRTLETTATPEAQTTPDAAPASEPSRTQSGLRLEAVDTGVLAVSVGALLFLAALLSTWARRRRRHLA